MNRCYAAFGLLMICLAGCSSPGVHRTMPTDPSTGLIIAAGHVITGDLRGTLRDQAIVVRNGRIAAITSIEEARRTAPELTVLDARGLTVLPGLTDAHAHIESLGKALETVSLVNTSSYEEVIARIKKRAAETPKGEWIIGRGWDQNDWLEKVFPDAKSLDRSVPDHPVWVERIDGHAGLANSAAMRIARITASSEDPSGGKILRLDDGSPAGVFVDAATDLIDRAVPTPTRAVRKRRIQQATRTIAGYGITSVHDAGVDQTAIELFQELADEGALPIRVYLMLSDNAKLLQEWFARGPLVDYKGLVTVRSVKLYADGALGSRGAALLEPYDDEPANSGLLLTSAEHIRDVSHRARAAGFQVNTHAIGDRAVRMVLDAYEKAGVVPADRFRIEHLQVIAPDDLPRLGSMGIIASMQPTHATSDMPWAGSRLGPTRVRRAYAWRQVLASGGRLALGSDFPVEEVNPWLGIHAAVTRQDGNGQPEAGWYPEERLTLDEAIRGFSADAAYAAFQERDAGTIEPGRRADFTLIANDLDQQTKSLRQVVTRFTITGGRVVFKTE